MNQYKARSKVLHLVIISLIKNNKIKQIIQMPSLIQLTYHNRKKLRLKKPNLTIHTILICLRNPLLIHEVAGTLQMWK